ncbi:hypothetical protein [Sphingomonas sp. GC_Shp_4]|nr:hypothetical protein [Sphingomonas sp. GC_Shp_4]
MMLLKPFRYLAIRHRSKLTIDVVAPIALGGGLTALIWWSHPAGTFTKDGYVGSLQNLLTVLGGFFVAALTLITTATLPMLKEPVGGREPPHLKGEGAPLSRKRFLAYMFGYLSTSSFCLVAISVVAIVVAPGLSKHLATDVRPVVKWLFVGTYNLWVSHVFITTLLGMFYFTERLQMSDGRAKIGKPDAAPSSTDGVRVELRSAT